MLECYTDKHGIIYYHYHNYFISIVVHCCYYLQQVKTFYNCS